MNEYLRDVLGITQWIRPESSAVFAVYGEGLSEAEHALLDKMMKALNVEHWELKSFAESPAAFMFVFGPQAWQQLNPSGSFEEALGQVHEFKGSRLLLSHPLVAMCDSSSPQRQQLLKKQTWEHLKKFSAEWNHA